jgi:hypothetical protein
MWVFTLDGFYSVVQQSEFCSPDEVVVRSRVREDLERMLARLERVSVDGEEPPPILSFVGTDYAYRAVVKRLEWGGLSERHPRGCHVPVVQGSSDEGGSRSPSRIREGLGAYVAVTAGGRRRVDPITTTEHGGTHRSRECRRIAGRASTSVHVNQSRQPMATSRPTSHHTPTITLSDRTFEAFVAVCSVAYQRIRYSSLCGG